uniref:Uncharacterized protein n=1 Tax=Nelumbo nucifera TaxID=4432 RepID=A0A822ZRI2_NELNU|nr:TPA_asm: hypothetical protein HUJ06_017037 [Nelumbo nucifera]
MCRVVSSLEMERFAFRCIKDNPTQAPLWKSFSNEVPFPCFQMCRVVSSLEMERLAFRRIKDNPT